MRLKKNTRYLLCDVYKIINEFNGNYDNSDFAISQKLQLPKNEVSMILNRYLKAKIEKINEKARV